MNKKFSLLILFLILFDLTAPAQIKYWIKFKDKNGTPYSVSTPTDFLTQKSIDRRAMFGIAIDATDLPVTPQYLSSIDTVQNVNLLYASKWLNGAVISVPNTTIGANALAVINNFPFVESSSRVRRYKLSVSTPVVPSLRSTKDEETMAIGLGFRYGGSRGQNDQINVTCLHESGFRGQGMTIAVMDGGFQYADINPVFDSIRNGGRILGTRDFVNGGANAYVGGEHGSMVLSCMAGNKPDVILGSAPMANYWLLRTEEGGSETISEEYNWIRAAEFADSVGADILTTSLGYVDFNDPTTDHSYADLNGKTAPMSIASTMAVRKGIFVLTAAGNEGGNSWKHIIVPGDADSVCTVGAVDTNGVRGAFSSIGPTSDGRIKPDLAACGVAAWVSGANANCFPANGTSFATPVLAGGVACFWQANRHLHPAKLLDTLKKTATNASSPNNQIGWGVARLPCAWPCNLKASFTYSLEMDGVVTFKNTSSGTLGGATYTWVLGDGTTATGPTVIHRYKNNASVYSAYLVVSNNISPACVSTTEVKTIKPEFEFDFNVFVDEKSVIVIKLTKIHYNEVKVHITDLNGKIIHSSEENPNNFEIRIESPILADMMYLVRVETSKGSKTKKIIKD